MRQPVTNKLEESFTWFKQQDIGIALKFLLIGYHL